MPAGVVLMCPSSESAGGMLERDDSGRPVDELTRARLAYRIDAADLGGLPPMLIQSALGDAALDEARSLADRAQAAGVDVRVEEYRTDPHMFQMFWSFLPEGADAMVSVRDFIASTLASASDVSEAR
jgi:acetyl esterase/lipase